MQSVLRSLLALAVILAANLLVGCGGNEKPSTPQDMEKMRQRDLERAKAFQREG